MSSQNSSNSPDQRERARFSAEDEPGLAAFARGIEPASGGNLRLDPQDDSDLETFGYLKGGSEGEPGQSGSSIAVPAAALGLGFIIGRLLR